ncbi:MAG: Fe-S cluster-containing hydrogenase [Saprospiraceae bacterium]|nr:Fe-S cluster-containing hydrogenase [Saprospiraceae bacterium]
MHHDNGIWVSTEDLTREESFLQSAGKEFSVENMDQTDGKWETNRRDFLKLLGFGLGAATLAASCEIPVKKAIPYVTKPDEIVPGVANYYASSFVNGGDYCAVLVKTREGRPIKIEGNTLSSVTKGGTSARAQASVLSLYDTRRIQHPGTVKEGNVTKMEWVAFDREVKAKLAAGGNIRIIANTIISPTAKKALAEFQSKYPNSRVITYDPVSAAALLAANQQSFGQRVIPDYKFGAADVIVSFGADFLGTWISPVEYAREYAKKRKIRDVKGAKMSRHYQIESHMSLTGSNADNRILIKPSEMGAAIVALYNELTGGSGGPKLSNEKSVAAIKKMAKDLTSRKGKTLVVCGSNNVMEQLYVNKINELLGNINSTVDFNAVSYMRQGDEREMMRLIDEMNAGQVAVAIVWGANPAWDLPNASKFSEAFAKVGTRISFNGVLDETTLLCTHSAPTHHFLESWGDAEPKAGHFSLIQPTIAPLFNTRQAEHSLLEWADSPNLNRQDEQPYYQYLKSHWANEMFKRQSRYSTPTAFWDMSLHDGVLEIPATGTTVSVNDIALNPDAVTKPSGSDIEVSFYETVNIGGGQYAHNPWLQEMPDPVHRTVWGNYLSIPVEWDGVNKIKGWNGLQDGDMVDVEVNGQKITCTVVRTFGQPTGTVAIALGGGREAGGCGVGYGVNVNPALPIAGGFIQYFAGNVNVSGKVGADKHFPTVQFHHTMGVAAEGKEEGKVINVDEKALGWKGFQGALTDRSIIFHTHVKDLPKFADKMEAFHEEASHLNEQTLYPDRSDFFGTGVKWGMYVDMNACVGCGACQVACVSENNVPVVGKKEVHRHHEMTWLRIDRYFYGDFENPKVVYQPMMCQHCDNAPCENVCPVNATNHSMEGINQMAYNRCIGTRYCANNCPYKVRRFNWLDYTTADTFPGNEEKVFRLEGDDKPFYADNLVRMVLNPDVTVRSRGVIEKCTFCIQRIQEGKLTAKRESRAIMDNDVRTACQTACPTGAIVFGNLNNPQSEVSKLTKGTAPLAYQVLEEINVRPGVSYSAKVNNSNEELYS